MPKFDLGAVFNRFFKLLGENFGLFAFLGLVGNVLPTMAVTYFLYNMLGLIQTGWSNRYSGVTLDNIGPIFGASLAVGVLNLIVLSVITETAILRAVGKKVDAGSLFGHSLQNILPLFAIALLVGLFTVLGTIVFIIPGIIVALATWVAVPAYIGQPGLGIWGSVMKSFDLTRGNRWWLLLIAIVLLVAAMIIGGLLGLSTIFLAQNESLAGWSQVISSGIDGITTLLGSVFTVAIYVTLRESKERLSPENAASVFS